MPFTVDQVADLQQLKDLSTHFVTILDGEAVLCSDARQLTQANVLAINTLYTSIVTTISNIVALENV